MSVDLHVHSTASDGTLSPEEIVAEALKLGLTAVAIADHDTFGGVAAGASAAAGTGLTFIPAVEISVEQANHELHLLGYFADPRYAPLEEGLERVRAERLLRGQRTVEKLRELGIDLAYEDVERVADGAAMGRPHVATALVNRGVVRTPAEAFERFLRRGRPAYVNRYRLPPAEAIRLVREAGGLPVIAHPKLMHRDALIAQLVQQGVGGLEAYHVQHNAYDVKRYLELARELDLVVTGGTDSHGPGGSAPIAIGATKVPDICARALLEWLDRNSAGH